MKKIGILGGMGPGGTAELYMKIVGYFQENFNAKYDSDFPPFVIFSVPIPDVVESLENENRILEMLSEASGGLEREGCAFIVIACNTVQYLLDDLRESVKIPILGIAKVNAKFIKNKGYKKVGILATEVTIKKKNYDNDLEKIGIELIKPDEKDQNKITQVIMAQLAGRITEKDKQKLIEVVNNLKSRGSEAVLIACTDLPTIIDQGNFDVPLIDCTQVYADEAARLSTTFKSKTKV